MTVPLLHPLVSQPPAALPPQSVCLLRHQRRKWPLPCALLQSGACLPDTPRSPLHSHLHLPVGHGGIVKLGLLQHGDIIKLGLLQHGDIIKLGLLQHGDIIKLGLLQHEVRFWKGSQNSKVMLLLKS